MRFLALATLKVIRSSHVHRPVRIYVDFANLLLIIIGFYYGIYQFIGLTKFYIDPTGFLFRIITAGVYSKLVFRFVSMI